MRGWLAIPAVVIAGVLVVDPAPGAAQSQTVTVDDLKTPSSPGFVVLGVEPTSVQRPTTPRAVGLSLMSAVRDGGSLIPKNYAFEVAPYWFTSRPSLTYEDWNSASVAQTMLQSFALSFATTSVVGQGGQSSATGIGVGVRTLLLKGRETQEARATRDRIAALQTEIVRPKTTLAREDEINVELREQALQLQTFNRQRAGWVLEVAGAIGAKVEDGDFDGGKVTRYGFWATPGYRLEDRFVLLGVARYQRDKETEGQDLFDVGGRLQFDTEEFILSVEAVRRLVENDVAVPRDDMSSTRVVGTMDYRISDDYYLTASFGRDYQSTATGMSGLVSFLGLNVGLSKTPTVSLQAQN